MTIRNQFENLSIPQPDASFEQRIITKALAAPQQTARHTYTFRKLAVAAAFVVVLFTAVLTNLRGNGDVYDTYANLMSDSDIVSQSDMYDDLIIASGY